MASIEPAYKQLSKKVDTLDQLGPNGQSGFTREFQILRQTSLKYKGNKNYSTDTGECSVNKVKNRFKDILPFDSTRVKLPNNGVEGSDYINANFIKGTKSDKEYIASQGPLPNTVNDFWRMLWSFKVKVVVMLCREEENRKKKCQRYWCEDDEEKLNFGGIHVKTKRCVGVGSDFVMRTLLAEFQGEELTITQFHYTAWPDHGVPPTAMPLVELVKLVREYQSENDAPIVLHCSAGCGRTGTICGLDYTYTALGQNRVQDCDPYVIVENLRKQRHAMVQTKGQYEFLCRAMCCLFREKLNLPIEEEMDNHLYENVTQDFSNDDSDSDSLTPQSPAPVESLTQKTPRKENSSPATSAPVKEQAKKQKSTPPYGAQSVADKTRPSQISQNSASDSYVNVSLETDLIDLSGDGPAGSSSKSLPSVPRAGKQIGGVSSALLTGFGPAKLPVRRQVSCDDYVVPNKPRNPTAYSETSDYVVVPPKETQSPVSRKAHTFENTKRSNSNDRKYENVHLGAQARPAMTSRPVVAAKNTSPGNGTVGYENMEVPFKPGNPAKKTPIAITRTSQDKPAKGDLPNISPKPKSRDEFFRNNSSSEEDILSLDKRGQKFSSCGPRIGAKFSDQLTRARILPYEEAGGNKEAQLEQAFFNANDVNSGLYASVGTRNRTSPRQVITENTFNNSDSVDGHRPPEVPRKSADIVVVDGPQHDSNNDAKGKASSSNKIKFSNFISKKPETKGHPLENIGFGIRLPKPKGPRIPPKSWAVRS